MEKNRLLEPENSSVRGRRVLRIILPALLAFLLLTGCGLPNVIVYDDPLTPAEHIQLGHAYEIQGKLDLAAREYGIAARGEPLAWQLLGNVRFQQGDYDSAENAYRQAVRRLPDHPDPYNNLAWLLYAVNRNLAEAEAMARRAVALAPPERKALYLDTLDKILKLRE